MILKMKGDQMINTHDLQEAMDNCYGTESYHILPLLPLFKFTDGVDIFCEKAEAYWFLTDTLVYIMRLLTRQKKKYDEEFYAVYLKVSEEGPADLIITDGNETELFKHHYKSVSVPKGEWLFFYEYGVLLWHMEH